MGEIQKKSYDRGYIRGIGSYFAQIWHSTNHDQVPFYPLWFNQFLNRKLPVILDTNNLMLVYASVPIWRTILESKANMVAQARICLYKVGPDGQDTDEVYDHPILDLLKKPHPVYRGMKDFIAQWCIMRDIYQTCLVYKNKVSRSAFPTSLIIMPTGEFKINPTGYLFDQLNIDDIIESYEHINTQAPDAIQRKYLPHEIMRYVDGQTDRYFFGIPKIVTNKLLISNLQTALQSINISINDMGARGILSSQSSDKEGGIPLDDDERKSLENSYRSQYGIGEDQSKIIITNANLKFTPITWPLKDMMLYEGVEQAFCALCDMYGMQRGIYADTTVSKSKDSIGGDGKGKIEEAMKICIETTGQQTINDFLEGFNIDPNYGLIENGKQKFRLRGLFDHLPVMQEDRVDAEQVEATKITALHQALSDGAITITEYRERLNLPPLEESIQQQSVEEKIRESQIQIRSTVGGTEGLIQLNAAVAAGQTSREAAVAIVINIYGFDEATAEQMIGEEPEKKFDENEVPPTEEEQQAQEDKAFKKALKKFKL